MIYLNTKKKEKVRITKRIAERIKTWKYKYLFLFLLLAGNLHSQHYLGINFNFKDEGLGLNYQYTDPKGGIFEAVTLYSEESSMIGLNFGYRTTPISSDFDIFPTVGIYTIYSGNAFKDSLKPKSQYQVKPSVGFGTQFEVFPIFVKLKFDALWNQPTKDIGILFNFTIGARLSERWKCEDKNRRI